MRVDLRLSNFLEEVFRQLAQPVWARWVACGRELAVDVFQRVCERRDVGILLDPVFEEGFNGGSPVDRVQDVRTDRGILPLHVILMFRAQLRPWWCIFRVDASYAACKAEGYGVAICIRLRSGSLARGRRGRWT